ncbi:MAG: leucine-rich repeat domain-containing protein [Proteobacteria bacterium]|nr:leucine-rich repeat domain-containing protein [Pseudomonadota bacterium]
MLNYLSKDPISKIFTFLSQEEAFALRATCKIFNEASTSNTIVIPYLKRLKALDNTVSAVSPENSSEDWCFVQFKSEFKRIAKEQEEEIKHFLEKANKLPSNPDVLKEITYLVEQNNDACKHNINLTALENRHHALERLNEALIVSCINVNSTKLHCSKYITRFPDRLFINEKYQNYWQTVEKIWCEAYMLKTLPKQLGICKALRLLYCSHTDLKNLPESIGDCKALEQIYCSSNRLQTLPNSLGNCQELQELCCDRNQLRNLPETLGNCKKLRRLRCGFNELKGLPESIGNCEALGELDCNFNHLLTLPESLGKCLSLWLNCSNNHLYTLPKSLAGHLTCDFNLLQALPESLGNCQNLRSIQCKANFLTDIPNSLKRKFGVSWVTETLNMQAFPAPLHHFLRFKLALLGCFTITTLIVALCGGFSSIAALLFKVGITLSTTKTALMVVSILTGLAATLILNKIAHIFRLLYCELRLYQYKKSYDKSFYSVTKNFTTSTGKAFIQDLQVHENKISSRGQLIQFKIFKHNTCQNIAWLKGEARRKAKEEVFESIKKNFTIRPRH